MSDARLINIVLIGPRGSGKSVVGAALAKRLRRAFVDLDDRVLATFADCETAREVWRTRGEAAWRDAEVLELDKALSNPGQIIALGGGTPCIPTAEEMIMRHTHDDLAVVVLLQCDVSELKLRLMLQPGDRPSLSGLDILDELEQVVEKRRACFERVATHTVDANGTPAQVVEEVIARCGWADR